MGESATTSMLLSDQRQRWRRGERITVERFLEGQTGQHVDPEVVLDLIYNEIVLREEAGERPQLEEYLQRFTALEEQIRMLFEVHHAIDAEPSSDVTSPNLPQTSAQKSATSQRSSRAPVALPGYEVVGELGRGGMGVVYKARQQAPRRLVALKMILADAQANAHMLARFRSEA